MPLRALAVLSERLSSRAAKPLAIDGYHAVWLVANVSLVGIACPAYFIAIFSARDSNVTYYKCEHGCACERANRDINQWPCPKAFCFGF